MHPDIAGWFDRAIPDVLWFAALLLSCRCLPACDIRRPRSGEAATEMAAVLNVAYATLVDDNVRGLYAQDVCTRLASCGALLS